LSIINYVPKTTGDTVFTCPSTRFYLVIVLNIDLVKNNIKNYIIDTNNNNIDPIIKDDYTIVFKIIDFDHVTQVSNTLSRNNSLIFFELIQQDIYF